MSSNRLAIWQAVLTGQVTVTLPVMVIMFGLFALEGYFAKFLGPMDLAPALLVLVIGVATPLPFAWLYWSLAIPRWKLWAYSRVDDLRALKKAAIRAGLIWRDGHPFEKTEICSKAMRQQILKLEGRA